MIEFFTYGSTNGHKVAIALEELGLDYEVHVVNVFAGEGRTPEFLALNPTGKIPVIRDTDTGLVLTESAAILVYLADKAGSLIPSDGAERMRALELLFLQASLHGPMFGQRMFFSVFAPETNPGAIRRYEQQADIIDQLVEGLLEGRDYFLDAFSVVDIAFFGWYHASVASGFPIDAYPSLSGWYARVAGRDAVQRGVSTPFGLPDFPARKTA